MKKFRGKKRYIRKLWHRISTYLVINIDGFEWCDFWHTHLDFFGLGNSSVRVRREHIKAHIALYNKLLKQLECFNKPYQSWIWIDMQDAGVTRYFPAIAGIYDIEALIVGEPVFTITGKSKHWEGEIIFRLIDNKNLDAKSSANFLGEVAPDQIQFELPVKLPIGQGISQLNMNQNNKWNTDNGYPFFSKGPANRRDHTFDLGVWDVGRNHHNISQLISREKLDLT